MRVLGRRQARRAYPFAITATDGRRAGDLRNAALLAKTSPWLERLFDLTSRGLILRSRCGCRRLLVSRSCTRRSRTLPIIRMSSSPNLSSLPRMLAAAPLFEVCERRLVLSAQLLFDVLGDQALEMHQEPDNALGVGAIPIETHLQEAHAASGWNDVQRQFGLTGKGQTVAVIDSGVAWDHVALGQGYGPGYRVVGGWDFTEENDAQPYDDGPMGFHGTHVTGIIGANDPTHSGVAPDVDIVALRVFNDYGQGQLAWVERALQWVHDNRQSFEHPITTVNLSLGTTWNANVIPSWATLEDELQSLFNDGIVVTASAGNSFKQYQQPGLSYPAVSSYVLPVASVDEDGGLSDFSQRSSRVIAAPGRDILSTVPDHVLGRDGKIDDYSTASGTSMAAPYVAGASMLVRQAMEMVGYTEINTTTIADHMHATADSVFDALTGSSYDRLNLERAIDALLPDDVVGDTPQAATQIGLTESRLSGWLNTLNDRDVYRFTADADGTLELDADSPWLETLQWNLQTAGQQIASGGLGHAAVRLVGGQTYDLFVSAGHEIGSFSFGLDFQSEADGGLGGGSGVAPLNVGEIRYFEQAMDAGSHLQAQVGRDGTFSVQWTNPDAQQGSLLVTTSRGTVSRDASWENGVLRVDVEVTAGQWLDIQLPGRGGDAGELAIANALSRIGASVFVDGSLQQDAIAVNLQNGLQLQFGEIAYAFPADSIQHLHIDGHGGNDSLEIVGSRRSDKVDLRPAASTLENGQISISIGAVEEVTFTGGGGTDRVYVYDSDGDDTLTARPRSAELIGVGYRFEVAEVERIFIHSTGGGQDYAFLYDSAGDDRLSVRPQFSSLTGDGFFNSVRGFERVYAYADAGGFDQADLYDSAGNDRFATSGQTASIVGPGFSSFTRSFDQVRAHSMAGGKDLATLYGNNSGTEWQQGSDFVSFRESGLLREARGFHQVETYIAGQPTTSSSLATAQSSLHPRALPEDATTPADAEGYNTERQEIAPAVDVCSPTTIPNQHFQRLTLDELPGTGRFESEWTAPAERLLQDPELELSILDEIFRQHDGKF
jgi:subtilisin family serine protease